MKRKLRNGIISGVSIVLAVSLLAASISSRQQVQAVDVFSETKKITQTSYTEGSSYNIAELVDDLSSFSFKEITDENGKVSLSLSAHVGSEELAYMVGGQEPYSEYFHYLSSISWESADQNILTDAYNAVYRLKELLEEKNLASEDLLACPIAYVRSDVVYRPVFYGNTDKGIPSNEKSFLEVTPLNISTLTSYQEEDGSIVYGYFIPVNSDEYGGVYEKTSDGKMVYRGSYLAYEGTAAYDNVNNMNSLVNYAYTEDDEDEEYDENDEYYDDDLYYEDEEYYEDDEYYENENYENDYYENRDEYQESSFYPTQPNIEEDPSPFYYEFSVEPEITNETITIYTEDNNSTLKQEKVKVLVPQYQSEVMQSISALADGDDTVLYSFYTVDETKDEQFDLTRISAAIPVTDDNKGEVKQFRYITLKNNEWLKAQVFGIGEDVPEGSNLDTVYSNFPLKVTSITTVPDIPTGEDNIYTESFNLTANPEIGSYSDWAQFLDSLKMLYIHKVPMHDINIWTASNIMTRVVNQKLALMVNDLETYPDCAYVVDAQDNLQDNSQDESQNSSQIVVCNNLKKLLYLAYQDDFEECLSDSPENAPDENVPEENDTEDESAENDFQIDDILGYFMRDVLPDVDVNDRIYEDEYQIAHFVRKNIYFIDNALVNTILYTAINKGVNAGFFEVQDRIAEENYKNEQNGTSNNKIGAVTRSLAIQYILTYSSPSNEINLIKSTLRILELQPCNDFDYAPMNITYNGMANSETNQDIRNKKFKEDFNIKDDVTVEIIGMTTSEFCGRIEDLNVEYDMIYWGANVGTMSKFQNMSARGDYCTAFNDYSMTGNIYTHVGDINTMTGSEGNNYVPSTLTNPDAKYAQNKYGFASINDSSARDTKWLFRYSGNDILSYQVDKLLGFLNARYPIVVADKFFVGTNENAFTMKVSNISSSDIMLSNIRESDGNITNIDPALKWNQRNNITRYGILDTSSYVYQFVKDAVDGDYPNFMTVSQAQKSDEILKEYLNQPKLVLNMLSQPVKYITSMVDTEAEVTYIGRNEAGKVVDLPKTISVPIIEDANYILPNRDGGYDLSYEFYISNATGMDTLNSTYTVTLYIDANMDGRYTARETIDLDSSNILDLDSGRNVNYTDLQSGIVYRIDRALPDGYIGALDWKLEVKANTNSSVRAYVQDISAVHKEKEDIYICQFIQTKNTDGTAKKGDSRMGGGGYDGDGYQILGDNASVFKRTRLDLWTKLLEKVPDFNVHIITVDVDDYFKTNGYLDDAALIEKYSMREKGFTFTPDLSGFDMLLFGYADGFMQSQQKQWDTDYYGNQERMNIISKFISEGKSVLFSHDTSARSNRTPQYNTFNVGFRDIMGMDRFGNTVGRTFNAENYSVVCNGQVVVGESKNDSVEEKQEDLVDKIFGTDGLNGHNRDIAFEPGSYRTKMAAETNAFTYTGWDIMLTNAYKFRAFDYDKLSIDKYTSLSNFSWQASYVEKMDSKVTQVNKGAITNYPYVIPEEMDIDYTHCQYYQLDLESDADNDGEGDIVVWYTIDNSLTVPDLYNISPHDVRNNYYVYNKDNIIYTGMGQTPINNPDEVKLFINTMIAAYRVGTKNVDVKFTQTESDLHVKTSDVIPYDENVIPNDAVYPVYFQVRDSNLVSKNFKKIYYKLYLEDKPNKSEANSDAVVDSELTPLGITKPVMDITNIKSYSVVGTGTASDPVDGADGYKIISNEGVYQINVPMSLFKERDEIVLYLRAYSDVDKGPSIVTTSDRASTIRISKQQLFNMD